MLPLDSERSRLGQAGSRDPDNEFHDHTDAPAGASDDSGDAPAGASNESDSDGEASGGGPALTAEIDIPNVWERVATWVIVAACCGFVFYSLHPQLILANTTPTGGDMGAHVWGPPFLRDHLLPQFRLSGWTMDWYAGFPAYLFYMVVPSLIILWLAASPPIWLAVILIAGVIIAGWRFIPSIKTPWVRHLAIGVAIFGVILFTPVPYNIAFKLVVVSGLVTLPIATCALAKALKAPFPIAPLVAVATLPFIYDKGFTILGGNGASTMAGEFAFSISLTLAFFYLAVLFKGAETGRWRAPGAILLALTVLCHIIPAIFVVIVTVVVVPFLRHEAPGVTGPERGEPASGDGAATDVEPADAELADAVPVDTEPADEVPVDTDLADAVPADTEPADEVLTGVTPATEEPWWSTSLAGKVAAVAIIAILWLTLIVDRSGLYSTSSHTTSVTGLARLQHYFPALATFAALVFFTSFQPRVRNWLRTPLGSAFGIAVTILYGGVVLVMPNWWAVVIGFVFLGGIYFVAIDLRSVGWVAAVGPPAALLTAFWMLPFLSGSTYMNDMGWEKYTRYWDYLLAVPEIDSGGMPLRSIVFVAAGLGLVLSVLMKVRLGWLLGLIVMVFAWMFRFFPQYRLWNARLLPFYFLAIYLLTAITAGLIIRWIASVVSRGPSPIGPRSTARILGAAAGTGIVLVALLGSFKQLPGGQVVANPDKPGTSVFRWAGLTFPIGIVPDWASWNFSGVERKPAYPEFKGVVDMMANVGRDQGCGRTFWEFDPELNRFGTTMSLMMLPYYTNGCISSMEGLYFEASSTTPFHFLMQSALSTTPSRAQREMPYPPFNLDLGIQQMQLMGVRYYLASSEQAIGAAEKDGRLIKLADETFGSGSADMNRWAVFEVRGIRLVEGLENDPVVVTNANDHIDGWVYDEKRLPQTELQKEQGTPGSKSAGPAVDWFMEPLRWDVFLATSGPKSWPRAKAEAATEHRQANKAVNVSNVKLEQDSVRFDVDRTGVPVLVKVSYFPNWNVEGAAGPYRVSPNFMVVVPSDRHVELSYGRSAADLVGVGLSLIGLGGVFGLAVLDDRRRRLADIQPD